MAKENKQQFGFAFRKAMSIAEEISQKMVFAPHFSRLNGGETLIPRGLLLGYKISNRKEEGDKASFTIRFNYELGFGVMLSMYGYDSHFGFQWKAKAAYIKFRHDRFCRSQAWMCECCTHRLDIEFPLRAMWDSNYYQAWSKHLAIKYGVKQYYDHIDRLNAGELKKEISLMKVVIKSQKPYGFVVWSAGGVKTVHTTRASAETEMEASAAQGKKAELYLVRVEDAKATIESANAALRFEVSIYRRQLPWKYISTK